MGAFFAVIIVLIIILALLASCIRIVPQAQALVVERLGAYLGTWSVGVHIKMPILDRVAKRVNLKAVSYTHLLRLLRHAGWFPGFRDPESYPES